MRGSIKKTPTSTKQVVGAGVGVVSGVGGVSGVGDDSGSVKVTSTEKSGRKLVQARLPFKIIAPATDEGVVADDGGASVLEIKSNPRKRKLYESESEQGKEGEVVTVTECSKENLSAVTTTKKSKLIDGDGAEKDDDNDVVILLEDSDSCDSDDHDLGRDNNKKDKQTPNAKKNRKTKATPKSGKRTARRKSSVGTKSSGETAKSKTTKTPKISESLKATPMARISIDGDTNETPRTRQIDHDLAKDNVEKDLNVSVGVPNKRRKSLRNVEKTTVVVAMQQGDYADVSSDDAIAVVQNPQKRLKVTTKSAEIVVVNKMEEEEKDSKQNKTEAMVVLSDENDSPSKSLNNDDDDLEEKSTIAAEDMSVEEIDITVDIHSILNTSTSDKILTPKQKKLHDQRQKAREEKEMKLQKEKEQKQLEKEQRDQEKKREREQREEQRRKEREEKEEQRRKERDEKDQQKRKEREEKDEQRRLEREEKERKRNAEMESKNEEKRKKEQEKEEAELKKKRAAAAFTKFFVQKPGSRISIGGSEQEPQQEDDSTLGKQLAFQPFQIKGDMKLAPLKRNTISLEARGKLDGIVHYDGDDESDNEAIVRSKPLKKSQLYVSELRSGKITPSKWIRPTPEMSQDVVIVDDEMERIGQAIDVEHKLPVEHLRAKFFMFHENRRPPYYGTWRKKTSSIKPRRPFAQDTKYLDYEVDSDLEWEEEEPGESLDGSDDDKEKESEDEEDYEVDNEWFVPHGHLSDEELQNDDEFDDGNTREAQKAKLQILQQEFAQEMRKETKKIKPRLIGCIWTDINGNKPEECPNIIWESLNKRAMLCMGPPIVLEEPKPNIDDEECNSSPAEKPKPIVLSLDLQKDLIRLVHGNKHSKNFLITEYLAYLNTHVEAIQNGEVLLPSKAMVREKIDEFADWQVVEQTADPQPQQCNNTSTAAATTSTKKQKKPKKRLCWIVAHDVLLRFELTELALANNWNYISAPKFMTNSIATDVKETSKINNEATESADEEDQQTTTTVTTPSTKSSVKSNNVVSITKFTKVLTAKELRKAATIGSPTTSTKINDVSTSSNNTKTTTSSSNKNDDITSLSSSSSSNAQQKKKRVPLLMSVPRGEQIPTAAKNVLISKFLKKGEPTPITNTTPTTNKSTNNNSILTGSSTTRKSTVIDDNAVADDDDEIIMLD